MPEQLEPLRLYAVEYRKVMAGGNTKPRLVQAMDDEDEEYSIVLKLRNPKSGIGQSHTGATSLACELICSIVARALGLRVPDFAIVDISEEFVNSLHSDELRTLFRDNIGDNFGTKYVPSSASWHSSSTKKSNTIEDQLENIVSFDNAVMNYDRRHEKTNLLYSSEQLFLIDHSLAIQSYNKVVQNRDLMEEQHIRSHCAYQIIHELGLEYIDLFERWSEQMNDDLLAHIQSTIPLDWEEEVGDLDKILEYLRDRENYLVNITHELCRVLQ